MPRKPNAHSRTPPVTAREFKLEQQIKQLRAEIATLRQTAKQTPNERVGLSPEERLTLVKKISNMFRNCVLHRISAKDRCPVCGGMTEDQIRAGWIAWITQEEECVDRARAWRASKGLPSKDGKIRKAGEGF
ncbi:MAG: hypothetical protein AAFP97_08675 [Pseudomonadota bacterium]